MAVVTLEEVQQWLEQTKMSLATLDIELVASAESIAFATVGNVYDTSTWADASTTPKLVRAAISMLVAAWEYQRAYGEEEDSTYGRRLERRANELLEGIADGTVVLIEVPGVIDEIGTPLFYPNDSSNVSEVYDASGNYIAANDDVKFRMAGNY